MAFFAESKPRLKGQMAEFAFAGGAAYAVFAHQAVYGPGGLAEALGGLGAGDFSDGDEG